MILTRLPDLPPGPETAGNRAFRRWFYSRWGRENAVVCGYARRAEYATLTQRLSVKAVFGGREQYLLPHREIAVDDDTYLVLNEGAAYGSRISGTRAAFSLAVFFRTGMVEEVVRARMRPIDEALSGHAERRQEVRFSEHLRAHDPGVSRRLRALASVVMAGERDEDWLEQALCDLADALLEAESIGRAVEQRLDATRASTRRELARRLRLAADFIASCHTQKVTLAEIARSACLSRFHLIRHFRQLYGMTPHAFLVARRTRTARRLIARGEGNAEIVALASGFGSRHALQRALKRYPARGDADADCAISALDVQSADARLDLPLEQEVACAPPATPP